MVKAQLLLRGEISSIVSSLEQGEPEFPCSAFERLVVSAQVGNGGQVMGSDLAQ